MNEEEITQFEEALQNLPEEVKDFLYGGDFENAVSTIANTHGITEEQTRQFDLTLTDVICLLKSKDVLIELFTSWGFPQEKQALLAKDIDEKIFMPIIEATNYIVIDDEEEMAPVPIPQKLDPYAELQKRLSQTRPIVAVQRKTITDGTFPLPPKPSPGSDQTTRMIDPYRERPE